MLDSILRTAVPVIVGLLLGLAAKAGLNLPGGAVSEIVTVILTTAYYAAGRYIESTWPRLGQLLLSFGLAKGGTPTYARTAKGRTTRLPRI